MDRNNSMKRVTLYIGMMAVSLAATSCSDSWLDLNPSTSVTTDQALSTLTDIETALNGVYRETSLHSYYGDNYWYYGDCRAMDVQARVTKGDGRRVSPYYEEEGGIEGAADEDLASIKAEALVLRGLALFNLTRFFGMPYMYDNGASLGVPIVTSPTDPTSAPARNTVAECYGQVVADFTEALPDLTREKADGYVNYWAAQALLSRVYLDMGEYQAAWDAATDVIENNGGLYQLYTQSEYAAVWGQDFQSESLFELYITMTEPAGGTGGEGAPMVYANEATFDWNNLILTEDYLDLLEQDPDDVRHSVTVASVTPDNGGLPEAARDRKVFLTKFPGKTGNPQDNDICIIRLSEVYLNAAEAGFHLGGSYAETGRTYLNDLISQRTPNTGMQVSTAGFTIDRILEEVRRELVGEGQVFFDFLRNGKPIVRNKGWHLVTLDTSDAWTIQPNDLRIALPIPQTEIDANPNMVQNPR